MPKKRTYRRDPLKAQIVYAIDAKENLKWCGELSYSINKNATPANIKIYSQMVFANTKKVPIGIRVDTIIFISYDYLRKDSIGVIERLHGYIQIVIGLPWQIANHIHLILLSGNAKSIYFEGTELFRRQGIIRAINISENIEDSWGSMGPIDKNSA